MGTFVISNQQFQLSGHPFRILSGAMHYFRIPPEYWADRLHKLRAMGLNTVETYVSWNLHEPHPGEFHFEGGLDLARYIRLAAEEGLQVLVRPGPYICAEWDFGGLPYWLLASPDMQVRCAYPPYLAAVDRFFDALLPQLAPLQITKGGPIIAMQVENEYGSYGNDKVYLRYLEDGMRARGIDVMLFTSDGPDNAYLECGTLPHLYKTVNFGSRAVEAFAKQREFQPDGPLMCTEYWNGWFDHWGEQRHTRSPQDAAATLDEILGAGASVSLYMFHGGTNFGLTAGANESPYPDYQATITSYDYDAALDEAGDPTPKYFAMQEVIRKYAPVPDLPRPEPCPKMALGPVALTESLGLFDHLGQLAKLIKSAAPQPMEVLDQNVGFILYRTWVEAPLGKGPLVIEDLHDRAQVFLDGKLIGVLEREFHQDTLEIDIPAPGAQLDILVENMGRINYGPHLLDRKGILRGVRIGQRFLFGWEIYPLPFDDLSQLPFEPLQKAAGPGLYRGEFQVDEPLDTYLALPGWTKGLCWVNGTCLGRYWSRGPQHTLFVPAPILRKGENEVVVFEVHDFEQAVVEFRGQPQLQ